MVLLKIARDTAARDTFLLPKTTTVSKEKSFSTKRPLKSSSIPYRNAQCHQRLHKDTWKQLLN